MRISIEYCGTCNYRPRAAALAASIREALGVTPQLVHSNTIGVYNVLVDDDVIYSKYQTDTFPEKSEIIGMLKQRQGS